MSVDNIFKNQLFHGVAYYPELWDEKDIERDIFYMLEAGINIVRMGEFAWSQMEPEEDKIDLDFFVRAADKLLAAGIKVIMCTPTPTPPIWLTHNHAERLFVNYQGVRMNHGSRQHICTNHPYFRKRAAIITQALAKTFGQHKAVVAWQLDNEFKCHVSECCCETCLSLWHQWLEKKYKTIDNLNAAWGTEIWSERYNHFEEVLQPKATPFFHNTSLQTNYRRFSHDMIVEFAKEQADIIRSYSSAPITHNSAICFHLDNVQLFKNLDFTSMDFYIPSDQPADIMFEFDLWKNVKNDKQFYVMETSPSHNGCITGYHKHHQIGFLRAEAGVAYANGARGFNYWLFRQQKSGIEQSHGSLLYSWGKCATGFYEAKSVDQLRREIEPFILNTEVKNAQAAITYSETARTFFATEPIEGLDYNQLMNKYYRYFLESGIMRDLRNETASLEGYKLLATPYLPFVSDEYLKKIEEFVKEGGVWLCGPMTGTRSYEHTTHVDCALGAIEKLTGGEVVYSYPFTNSGALAEAFGKTASLSYIGNIFSEKNGKCIGRIKDGITPGMPFIMEFVLGKGKIVTIAGDVQGDAGSELMKEIISHYCRYCGIESGLGDDKTVVIVREDKEYDYLFITNFTQQDRQVVIHTPGIDYLTDQHISGKISIEPYGYRIIKIRKRQLHGAGGES